ncbi:MAG: imm11 family protein [Pseudobacter sp.]|uniref:imm11 family protein n=1 Tax=Pseudobacter sp. TaxID=2045420 RepID=UPI003F80E249
MTKLLFEKSKDGVSIPSGYFHKKAKQTDLVSVTFASSQLLISQKLKEMIFASKHYGVEFFQTELIGLSGLPFEYWFVNPYESPLDMLDYSKSEFNYFDGRGKNVISNASIENKNELEKAILENRRSAIENPYPNHRPLKISVLEFKNTPVTSYDFFPIWGTLNRGIAFFVSQRLKGQIELAQCTGITFTDPNQVYP